MARKANFIEEINPTKDTWKLKIRITSLWRVEKSSAPSLEMIFMDVKGHKIQAGVKNYILTQWESQLKEGNSYIAENFAVVPNDGQYRAANHPFKLIFESETIIKCQELPEIPQHIFHFSSFQEILDGLASSDVLVDVIGELVTIEMSQVDSIPKKVVFSMKDQRDNQVRCTLWEQFATQFLTFEANHKKGPIVLLLTLAKIKEQKGGYPLSIQNTMYGSKLYINDDNIAEIQHYLNSLDSNQIYESYSQRLSQSSSSSQFGSQGKHFINAEIKHIAEINQTTKDFNCVTVEKIDKLVANGWYYDGCPQCNKKLPTNITNTTCPGCGKYLKEVVPRYRVEVNVTYDNESIKCVLWNGECEQLIKKKAIEIRKLMIEDGELNPMSIPQDVDEIVARTLAFKVKVQPTYRRCSVIQLSEDEQIIESIVQSFSKAKGTPISERGKSVINVDNEDDLYFCQFLSATSDYHPALQGLTTPAKGISSNLQFEEIFTQDLPSAKMSSTKMRSHIKKE